MYSKGVPPYSKGIRGNGKIEVHATITKDA